MPLPMMLLAKGLASIPTVSMDDDIINNSGGGACVALLKVDYDGSVYHSDNVGSYGAAAEVWLDAGVPDRVYISYTSLAGPAFDTDDCGGEDTIVQINQDIELGYGGVASKSCTVTIQLWADPSGSVLLDTADYTISSTVF